MRCEQSQSLDHANFAFGSEYSLAVAGRMVVLPGPGARLAVISSQIWRSRSKPAFSLLLSRATVMDRSLFSGSADRIIELEKWSGIPAGPALVDIAITHELGHTLCQEKNERLANEYGESCGRVKSLAARTRLEWRAGGPSNNPMAYAVLVFGHEVMGISWAGASSVSE